MQSLLLFVNAAFSPARSSNRTSVHMWALPHVLIKVFHPVRKVYELVAKVISVLSGGEGLVFVRRAPINKISGWLSCTNAYCFARIDLIMMTSLRVRIRWQPL